MNADVLLYTTRFCPFCSRAKQLLDQKGVEYRELAVDGNSELRQEMIDRSGHFTVPQIWVADRHIGGCDDLWSLERAGKLDGLLQVAADV